MLHYFDNQDDRNGSVSGLAGALAGQEPSRRSFLKMTAMAAGGLVIGGLLSPAGTAKAASSADGAPAFTPFVRITPDNTVVVIVKHLDKGQGTATGLATLVADELDASVEQVTTEFAPSDAETYKNLAFGIQGTGGSTAMPNSFQQYREAGATARAMLTAAAAAAWGVPASEVTITNGVITAGDRAATFGEMAQDAAALPAPETVTLKTPDEWVYIGKAFPRVDMADKVSGAIGVYGMDVQQENMLVAVLARPPRFGATLASLDDSAARAVDGVAAILPVPSGVAVLADTTWQAMKGRDALQIEWDFSAAEMRGTDTLVEEYRALAETEGLPARADGDVDAGLLAAVATVEADYVFPYLAHTPMEPLDVTILYDGTSATYWTGSQIQTIDHNVSAAVLGIDPANIAINTVWAGGSFGRRAIYDSHYVAEAAMIAKAWHADNGTARPIKIVWTREDDVKGGYYRPLHVHKIRAGVDADGAITGWHHRIVGQGIMIGTAFESFAVKDGVDHSSVEGASDLSYAAGAMKLETHHPKVGVPVLWWRAVGHTHTAYAVETMIDELAEKAGMDAVAFRLINETDPRKQGVLRLAAEKAGWDTPPAQGRFRGVAVHKSFNSYVAEIAEVSLRDDGTVKVEKVTAAVDCGVPINPDNIKAQVEGGLAYGLGAVLREEITLTEGEVDQSNFYDYLPLRLSDMPEVDVHIVASTEAPTGIGEPGTPPIGPAVANAVAKATGDRVRVLPFSRHGLA
ncbi:MAG: xanthine dehydrogenase family protein molybdopterin-binding subunit [Pseudomonadota bacterium]